MKIYPVLSSDLYALSCVPVSMLPQLGNADIRSLLSAGGSLRFLVAQDTLGDIKTATGFMSKHVEYADISATLADDFKLSWVHANVQQLSDFVKKNDLQNAAIVIDSLPTPYIVSAFHLSDGYITEISGYALSDALSQLVPQLKYASVSADTARFDDLSAPVIDSIFALIPRETSTENQLADKQYVSTVVHENAASFRGTFADWANVPSAANLYTPDLYGISAPDYNDYMVVNETNTFSTAGGVWPSGTPADMRQGMWRFRYTGKWDDSSDSSRAESKGKWQPEYRIEHYNFTDAQMRTINSQVYSSNKVVRPEEKQIGGTDRGIYVAIDGTVAQVAHSLETDVPPGAYFTETRVLPGDGVNVLSGEANNAISSTVSLKPATPDSIGGIRVGVGLSAQGYLGRVDAATVVKIVDVAQNDASTPEELSSVFGDEAHVGALMIVRRGYDLTESASYIGYVYTGQAWEAMAGNCCADNVILPSDIELTGTWSSVGNVANSSGGVFACGGKPVSEAFRMIFGNGNMRSRIAYPNIVATSFVYNSLSVSPISGQYDQRITVTGDISGTTAANREFIMEIPAGYEWPDGTTAQKTVVWTITPIPVYLPDLEVQNSGELTGPAFDTDIYGVTGQAQMLAVGEYECTLTLSDSVNYAWGDGYPNAERLVTWAIV